MSREINLQSVAEFSSQTALRPRLLLAGTHSGVGKTTLTLGLLAALRKRGLAVQGFKAGPDYIDPSYHTAVTHRPARNLDRFMVGEDGVREIFWRASADADLSVIEGVMGLYDGRDVKENVGSSAELALLLQSPIILVIDASGMARSAAALVLGFQKLLESVPIAGVLVNRVGSIGHYRIVQTAIEQECNVPTVGYLPKMADVAIPERHLGLIPALERGELSPLFDLLAKRIEESVDVARLLEIAQGASALSEPSAVIFTKKEKQTQVKIAIAKDAAFNFYYPENLELLELAGADLHYFSPLAGDLLPDDVDGLYIGGGFPEEFAGDLSARTELLLQLYGKIKGGLPTFAECGGYMFLAKEIVDRAGKRHPMVGVIPATVKMQENLAALGYREATALVDHLLLAQGETVKGHEFHYSTLTYELDSPPYAYEVKGLRGKKVDGFSTNTLVAGYTHLHFASNPAVVQRFIHACAVYQKTRTVAAKGE
ncbi:cobyrinate a,c-diamide synthase [Sulfoacidibacillus thermotolerans]|uniref:Cobyrinate a,c-diamide synthase n=1 Tax=Sulfoacidibacillus thermotolerans TaxID=1765684 RepID=A0A2U3DBR4_SULT2|nr:cobyrinate a,c-diamide synthase [Sulfoacidibacillus thermotolerans]PWI58728.1 cobyrinic acid a,c-diamide synthase [Sulfoacidibacillus thermotolerans]